MCDMRIYSCKKRARNGSVATDVVTNISEKLLGSSGTVITDNYYISLELTSLLLHHETHLKKVVNKKLLKGDIIAKENDRDICIIKWYDSHYVVILSTEYMDK